MGSSIAFMLFLALFMMVFMKSSIGRQIQMDDDDDFQISDAQAREFLDLADAYMKRANNNGNCITCSILTQSKCCAPDICRKKLLHNECIRVKPGK
jgi:hypothetical protein